jgi:hypothetical protein
LVSITTNSALDEIRNHIKSKKGAKGKAFWVGKAGAWSWKRGRDGKISYH